MTLFSKISVIIALSTSTLFACGDGDYEETPTLLFSKLLSDQKWEPFLPSVPRYSPYYYGDDKPELPSISQGIANEWHTYKPSVPALTWYKFLVDSGSTPDLTQDESTYFDFVSSIQPYVNAQWDWDYQGLTDEAKMTMKTLATDAVTAADGQTSNDFLRQRYIFQALRLALYAGDYESVLTITDNSKWESGTKNLTYWRMVALKAGALRNLKRNGESMVKFIEVANNAQELLYLGYRNAMFLADWKAGLKTVNDPQTRAMMLFCQNVYEDTINPSLLKELAKLEPSSSRLEVSMLKQLALFERTTWYNKLNPYSELTWKDSTFANEKVWSKILTGKDSGSESTKKSWWKKFWEAIGNFFKKLFHIKPKATLSSEIPAAISVLQVSNPVNDQSKDSTSEYGKNEAQELIDLSLSLAKNKQVKNKALYYLFASQMAFMIDTYNDAADYAAKAEKQSPKDPNVRTSAALFTALSALHKEGVSSKKFEESAERFLSSQPDSSLHIRFFDLTGRAYLNEKQFGNAAAAFMAEKSYEVSGELILDVILTIPELDSLQSAKKAATSKYLKALYGSLPDTNGFAELAGNKFMRCGEFAQAVTRFESCGKVYWNKKPNEKVIYRWGDTSTYYRSVSIADNDPFEQNVSTHQISRLAFAQRALDLSMKTDYKSLMAMGNLFFWDWGWHYSDKLWKGGGLLDAVRSFNGTRAPFIVSPELSTELYNRANIFMANYSSQQMAARYYEKAMAATHSEDEKSKALFAFATAKTTNWTSANDVSYSAVNKKSIFKLFKDSAKGTPFFDDMSNRCSELNDFITGKVRDTTAQ